MRFLYIATTGAGDATRASLPLHLAVNGSVEVGHETSVVIAGDGAELLVGDTLETLRGVGVPPAKELVQKLRDHSVPVYV